MFSLKAIEKKVSKGRKKKAVDISPHPIKNMKIDREVSLDRSYTFSNKLANGKKMKNNDVDHPMKTMKVELTKSSTCFNARGFRLLDEAESELPLISGNSLIKKGKTKRYFNRIANADQLNEMKEIEKKKMLLQSRKRKRSSAKKIDESMNTMSTVLSNSLQSCQSNDKSMDANFNRDNCNGSLDNSVAKKNKHNVVSGKKIKKIKKNNKKVMLRESNVDTSVISESSDTCSVSSDEETNVNWCPWREANYLTGSTEMENEMETDFTISSNLEVETDLERSNIQTPERKQPKTATRSKRNRLDYKKLKNVGRSFQKKQNYNSFVKNLSNMLGKFDSAWQMSENSIVLVLNPSSRLFIHGSVDITLLGGSASILGYKMKTNEVVTMHSPASYCLSSIDAICGENLDVDSFKFLKTCNLVSGNPEGLQLEDGIVVKLTRHSSPVVKFLMTNGWKRLFPSPQENKFWNTTLGATPIVVNEPKNHFSYLNLQHDWLNCLDEIQKDVSMNNDAQILLCGGQGVGKSTFLKLLVNTLLSSSGEKLDKISPLSKVACLDIDPGQPELSVPSTISLSIISRPLIGQPFTHFDNSDNIEMVKQIFLGFVSVESNLPQYFKAVQLLINTYNEANLKTPLIINTMGWTRDIGLDIILDVLRMVKPTHVIELQGHKKQHCFPIPLYPNNMNSCEQGITTNIGTAVLDYEHKLLSCGSSVFTKDLEKLKGKEKRIIRLLAYFSALWSGGKCKDSIYVDWTEVALHAGDGRVPRSHMLLALNGSMVALAKVEESLMKYAGQGLPKFLCASDLINSSPQCYGWGIVKSIDPDSKTLEILTPLSEMTVKKEVNAIIMPQITIPDEIVSLFSKVNDPYCQPGERKGAAKLHPGRKPQKFRKCDNNFQ